MIKELTKSSEYRTALGLPEEVTEEYHMLAQGEYNINYMFTHPVTGERLVLRVNAGSQMHLERQIEYEAHALKLIAEAGRTPRVLYVDDSRKYIDHGILVMDYLQGVYPDYSHAEEMDAVMECLADIHAVSIPEDEVVWGEPEEVPRDTVSLIAPADPAASILDECEAMVKTYMDSTLGDDSIKKRLRRLLDQGHEIAEQGYENNSFKETYRCCINTELNSTNFLFDGSCVRLVDWEKPLYADPAQDLGHLLAPTTTFWKTTTVLTQEETDRLIDKYIEAVRGRFHTDGIRQRTHRLIRITCLRGLTWCAMAWIQYQDPDKLIVNESTRLKLSDYLSDPFLKDIEMRFE